MDMKTRSSIVLNPLIIVVVLCALFWGCVATKESSSGVPKDTWTGEMTGMATAKLRLESWQADKAGSDTIIQGSVRIDFDSARGGVVDVTLRGRLTGRIKDGIMEAKFSGNAEGTTCMGDFIGTMSETQGFGTWKIDGMDEEMLRFSGEWTLAKQ
jgi:hypothetical protein